MIDPLKSLAANKPFKLFTYEFPLICLAMGLPPSALLFLPITYEHAYELKTQVLSNTLRNSGLIISGVT